MITGHTEFIDGIPVNVPNEVTKQTKAYHISYNNNTSSKADYGSDTTALYINETGQFLILDGNHTEDFSKCETLNDCLKYFYDRIEQANPYSEHGQVFTFENGKAAYVSSGF